MQDNFLVTENFALVFFRFFRLVICLFLTYASEQTSYISIYVCKFCLHNLYFCCARCIAEQVSVA